MNKPSKSKQAPVPEEAYTRDYYQTCCHGYEEFNATKGEVIPLRLSVPLKLAGIQPGMKVVDIGCGRGEIVLQSARLGAITWGLDYASEALSLARQVVHDDSNREFVDRMAIQQSKSYQLPFASEKIDRIFMLDIVEHLTPVELETTLNEVHRILVPGGQLIIHTMPNLWYYRVGYPIYRALQGLRGHKLPANPRDRWEYSYVHVNEQTPRKLAGEMKRSYFQAKIWLYSVQNYEYEPSALVRAGMEFLARVVPFRWFFCNDIFAIGTK